MGPEDQNDLPIEREEYEIWARKEEVKSLRRALVTLMSMIEKGILVRNVEADENFASYVEHSVGLTLALKQAQDAINLGRIQAPKAVEVFADHAEPCMHPVGLTTCGYPRAHKIHNDKSSMSYHLFEADSSALSPSKEKEK